jgi:hypothetical protein
MSASLIGHSGSSTFRLTRRNKSFGRPCRQCDGRSKPTYELTSSIVPQGTSFHRSVELEVFSYRGFDRTGGRAMPMSVGFTGKRKAASRRPLNSNALKRSGQPKRARRLPAICHEADATEPLDHHGPCRGFGDGGRKGERDSSYSDDGVHVVAFRLLGSPGPAKQYAKPQEKLAKGFPPAIWSASRLKAFPSGP